jgi:hypothetical protein
MATPWATPRFAPAADSQLSINGRVNFAQAGAGLLSINGHGYTVINDVAPCRPWAAIWAANTPGADIDASATAGWNLNAGIYNGFVPIGSSSDNTDATRFTGSFDGLGHSIRDLTVNVTQPQYLGIYGRSSYAGLFGTTGSAARIAHVGLDNASIKASGGSTNSRARWWGGTAALSSKAMPRATPRQRARQQLRGSAGGENRQRQHQPKLCHRQRHGGGYTNSAGALVGVNSGSISQSYATGSATAEGGNNSAGALVGENSRQHPPKLCHGQRHGQGWQRQLRGRAGGVNTSGSISQSYATGSATAERDGTPRARWRG